MCRYCTSRGRAPVIGSQVDTLGEERSTKYRTMQVHMNMLSTLSLSHSTSSPRYQSALLEQRPQMKRQSIVILYGQRISTSLSTVSRATRSETSFGPLDLNAMPRRLQALLLLKARLLVFVLSLVNSVEGILGASLHSVLGLGMRE